MKVAIIGAGLSGLSCAYELERRGITPVIFEKKDHIGEVLGFSGIWSRLIIHPFGDSISYLNKKYGLHLTPLSHMKEETIISPGKKIIVRGNLGYIVKRGPEKHSLENQIAAKVKTPIQFNTYVDIHDIENDFDHIVVATATSDIPKQMGVWTDTLISRCRVATVLGDFKTDAATVWFNLKYAKHIFACLIPNSRKEATLMLLINKAPYSELDFFWEEFLSAEAGYPVIEMRDSEHSCGFVQPLKKDNVYFVGNTAGLTDSFIGIGAFNAIESGMIAARCIADGLDYNKRMEPAFRDIVSLHEFRKAMNHCDNGSLDTAMSFIGLPVVKQLIFNNPFTKLKHAVFIPKLYNKLKGDQRV